MALGVALTRGPLEHDHVRVAEPRGGFVEAGKLVHRLSEGRRPGAGLVEQLGVPRHAMVPVVAVPYEAGDDRALGLNVVAARREPDEAIGFWLVR